METKNKPTELKKEIIINDDLKKRAKEKPLFKVLFLSDHESRLFPFRGSCILDTLSNIYSKQCDLSYVIISSNQFLSMNSNELSNYNILWIDNIISFAIYNKVLNYVNVLRTKSNPKWKDEVSILKESNDIVKYYKDLDKKHVYDFKIIYALDEFYWDAPAGRAKSIGVCQIVNLYLNLADTILVPTPELKELITYYPFLNDTEKEFHIIPTAINESFYPVFKNFSKGKSIIKSFEKPRILIKGLMIPNNVQEFIMENYKKMEITICTVGSLNEHIMGLLGRKKITHIYHWANPYVTKKNFATTYALERDLNFDFTIITKPDNLSGQLYDLSSGDDDILFAIASGSLPICGINDVGYNEDSNYLGLATDLRFGKNTSAKSIKNMIEACMVGVKWNEEYEKYKQKINIRTTAAPQIVGSYFNLLLGHDLAEAKKEFAKEVEEKMKKKSEEKLSASKQTISTEPSTSEK